MDKYGEINNWDVSNVTNMTQMFKYAESFNQSLNKWNVSNVENMERTGTCFTRLQQTTHRYPVGIRRLP